MLLLSSWGGDKDVSGGGCAGMKTAVWVACVLGLSPTACLGGGGGGHLRWPSVLRPRETWLGLAGRNAAHKRRSGAAGGGCFWVWAHGLREASVSSVCPGGLG